MKRIIAAVAVFAMGAFASFQAPMQGTLAMSMSAQTVQEMAKQQQEKNKKIEIDTVLVNNWIDILRLVNVDGSVDLKPDPELALNRDFRDFLDVTLDRERMEMGNAEN